MTEENTTDLTSCREKDGYKPAQRTAPVDNEIIQHFKVSIVLVLIMTKVLIVCAKLASFQFATFFLLIIYCMNLKVLNQYVGKWVISTGMTKAWDSHTSGCRKTSKPKHD